MRRAIDSRKFQLVRDALFSSTKELSAKELLDLVPSDPVRPTTEHDVEEILRVLVHGGLVREKRGTTTKAFQYVGRSVGIDVVK